MKKGNRRKACCERIFSFLLLLLSDKERKKSCKKIEVKCGVEGKKEKRRSSFVICLQTKKRKNERKKERERERERKNERKKERARGWKEESMERKERIELKCVDKLYHRFHEVFAKKVFCAYKKSTKFIVMRTK